MKSLEHNGIYIPNYSPIGLSVRFKERWIPLDAEGEQMAISFVRKLETPYVKDPVFLSNFLSDFVHKINPLKPDEEYDMCWLDIENYDWTDIQEYLNDLKSNTESMSTEDKKLAKTLKTELRDKLKEKYGYAFVDGKKMPLMNWTVEPAGIYLSKGKSPLRGRWKRSVTKDEITLNLSKKLKGGWGAIVWKPNEMWIASWKSPLDGKMKYVWFSPATDIRQDKERKKFSLASKLASEIVKLEEYIDNELYSKDIERRKLATAVYLIKALAIRVGDEKLAGEHGTIGCITLKTENIQLNKDGLVVLDFIGKDWVNWHRELIVSEQVYKNIKDFKEQAGENFIFKGIDGSKISLFLRESIPGLSAKVFRTYVAGTVWDEHAKRNLNLIGEKTSDPLKKYLFKMTNLEVAKKLNHKRALPKNYSEKLKKKAEKCKEEKEKLLALGKETIQRTDVRLEAKFQKLQTKVEKLCTDYELMKDTGEWNLGTSLTSYIDPNKVLIFVEKADLDIDDVYSKSLKEKYSWAIEERRKTHSKD